MKRLEYARAVQFYLSEKEELRIEDITGIFGPNGAGKSSWLDAIQIVMMGANPSMTAFNAQADNKTKRTIRSYCLGQYGEGERRARDYATTYITLVWRDTDTGMPISTGVCIYATADDEKHTVLGRYIASGIDLSLGDHLETVDGVERPMEWKSFRMLLQRRSEAVTGEREIFFEDGKPFVNGLLTTLRGSRGVPALDAFNRAFRFALRMRFDKPVDHIVRHDIIEDRPTDTGRFREITESFRKLNELVKYVGTKIEAGRKVADAYGLAAVKTQAVATWRAVSARVDQAAVNAAHIAASEQQAAAEKTLVQRVKALEGASQLVKDLTTNHQELQRLMVSHSAHKNIGQAQQDRQVAEQRLSERSISAARILLDAGSLLRGAVEEREFSTFAGELKDAATKVDAIARSETLSVSVAMAACGPMQVVARKVANHLLSGPMQESSRKLKDVDQALGEVKDAIGRVSEGKAPLNASVQALLSEFMREDLSPVPVCDVVRITDPAWQPVIEGFLGRNVEALLIEKGEESKAFRLYRELDARRNIFGVKVARASEQKTSEKSRDGSVAELIEGTHPVAVAYLRRQFGDLMRAEGDDEALAGSTLTRDGMLVRRGAFERIALVRSEHLKIGISAPGRLEQLKRTHDELQRERVAAEKTAEAWRQRYQDFSNLAGDEMVKRLQEALDAAAEAETDLKTAMARLTEVADEDYLKICNQVSILEPQLPAARTAEGEAREAKGKAEAELHAASRAVDPVLLRLKAVAERLSAMEMDQDYDQMLAAKQWDQLLARFDERYREMDTFAGRQIEDATKERDAALAKASNSFGEYMATYRDAPGEQVRDDWRQAAAWINAEVGRLECTELQNYREQADDAYRAAQITFRTDVANRLDENFSLLEKQVSRLNKTLTNCPTFSNGERYWFKPKLREQYKDLDKFIRDVATYGPENDLISGPGELPPEFESLMHDKALQGNASAPNPLDDYREFYDFDIEIRREDPVTRETSAIGRLSERLGAASGGEHRAPLYVIAGAALASAYRMDDGHRDGLRLILLDEAFDKMDMNNLVATMRYLEDLGLQVVLASPGENKGALDAFLHRYYAVLRDPVSNSILFEGHDVSVETRVAMRADLPEFHPELIEQELLAMMRERSQVA